MVVGDIIDNVSRAHDALVTTDVADFRAGARVVGAVVGHRDALVGVVYGSMQQ